VVKRVPYGALMATIDTAPRPDRRAADYVRSDKPAQPRPSGLHARLTLTPRVAKSWNAPVLKLSRSA
jgi:hypothetical protein